MPKGLSLPIRANRSGGLQTSEGRVKNSEDIFTALSDCDSDHAFQQELGLGSAMVFATNDPSIRPRILFKVREIFASFERQKRFKLNEDSIAWESAEGELILTFSYFDIEADEEVAFRKSFSTATGG